MIKNDRQFRITKAQAEKFERAVKEAAASPHKGVPALLQKAQIDALKSQLRDLRKEIGEYEELRSGKRKIVALKSLDDLPRLLIQARIASGLTQEELATRMGLKPQQIQRYEATDYHTASIDRMIAILRALGARLHQPLELRLAS